MEDVVMTLRSAAMEDVVMTVQERQSSDNSFAPPPTADDRPLGWFYAAAAADPKFQACISAIINSPEPNIVHRTVFVRGFGWDVTAETLLAAFQSYGDIKDCNVFAGSGPPYGVGLLLFETRPGAVNAIRQQRKHINNRLAHAQLMLPGRQPFSMIHPAYTIIYVHSIPFDYCSFFLRDFTALFNQFGETVYGPAWFAIPNEFVAMIYKNPEDAAAAVRAPTKMFRGREIHCSATPEALLEVGKRMLRDLVDAARSSDGSRSYGDHSAKTEIFLRDVDDHVADDKLMAYFAQFGEILAGPFRYDLYTNPEEWGLTLFIYKTQEGAENALQEPYKTIEDNRLYCLASIEDHVEAQVLEQANSFLRGARSNEELKAKRAEMKARRAAGLC